MLSFNYFCDRMEKEVSKKMKKRMIVAMIALLLVVTGCSLFGSKKDLSKYVGVWKNNDSTIPDEEIVIKKIEDDKVSFDYYLYRITAFNEVEGKLDGSKATFEAKNDLDWSIKGTIELEDDTVTLVITDSSSDLIVKDTKVFKIKGETSSIESNNPTPDLDVNNYVGVWRNDDSSSPVDELIINTPNGNEIPFEYLVDGITTFENGKATLNGNKAEFDVKNDLGWTLKGYFVMKDNQVTLTITECSSDNIQPTTITYELHRDKSNLK